MSFDRGSSFLSPKLTLVIVFLTFLVTRNSLQASQGGDTDSLNGSVWVSPGFYSIHFDRNAGLKDANPGFGVHWKLRPEWSLAAGRFSNSNSRFSNYVGAMYMPWNWGRFRFGGTIAAFDGYPKMRNGGWFFSVIPTVGIYGERVGMNLGIIPELKDRVHGTLSFQLLLRVQ